MPVFCSLQNVLFSVNEADLSYTDGDFVSAQVSWANTELDVESCSLLRRNGDTADFVYQANNNTVAFQDSS